MRKNLSKQVVIVFKEENSEGRLLEPQFSKHQVLIDLGLTLKQARVYLALVESGPLKIVEISKASNVARPDVYSALSRLQPLGLVEKIITTPLTYRAIPPDKGLSFLLEAKTDQYEKVRAQTRLFLDLAKKENTSKNKSLESPQFVLIPEGRPVLDRINTAIEKAQLSIDLVLSWKRFSSGIVNTFAESIEHAWAKKVKTRFVIESPSESKTAKQLVKFCREKTTCQMKFIPYRPATVFGIYDRNKMFVILFSKTDLPGSPALWSTNHSLISLAEDYFEILWLTSAERLDFDSKKIE